MVPALLPNQDALDCVQRSAHSNLDLEEQLEQQSVVRMGHVTALTKWNFDPEDIHPQCQWQRILNWTVKKEKR